MKSKLSAVYISVGFYFILNLMSCNSGSSSVNTSNPVESDDSWEIVLQEDFDNLEAWNIWNGGAFNNEIQLYREEQLSINNGILKITTERQSVSGATTPFDPTQKTFEFVSGRIESKLSIGPKDAPKRNEYRVLARIKLPFGTGMWPAFWTYGDPWPTQGEIDILEARGNEPNVFQSNLFYGTEPGININVNTEVIHAIGQNLTEDFHIYEMRWKQNSIEIYFDNDLIHTYEANAENNIANMFNKQQKIVFNSAVGGWFTPEQNSDNYTDNATMEVDWLKVYRK